MRSALRRQRGATLLVSLIMLVVLTLFAVSGFNLSSVNLKIAGNFQQQRYLEASLQQAIDQAISTSSVFDAPAAQTITVNGFTVAVERPLCNYTVTASGYSKKVGELTPEDTEWEMRASATDTLSGATAAMSQGLRVRLLAGYCP
jgi:Tfp pilus assembly protein PilX